MNSDKGIIRVDAGSTNQAGLSSNSNAGTTAIWAGKEHLLKEFAPFKVAYDGALYSANAEIQGHIEADTGSLGSLDLLGNLSMQENSSIIMGDPTAGDSLHIGDFNILGSGKNSTFLAGGISTSTSQSNSDAYSVSLDSDYNLSIDVDYDISSANNGTSPSNIDPNTGWELTIEIRCIGNFGTEKDYVVVEGRIPVAENIQLAMTPPNGTTSIELYRSAEVTMGDGEGFYTNITVTSNDDEKAVWTSSQDFIGKEGIRYSNAENAQFKLDTSFNATSSLNPDKDRIIARNGRLTMLDANGDKSISIDPRGAIIFWKASRDYHGTAFPSLSDYDAETAEAILFIERQGVDDSSTNRNLGWVEQDGNTANAF
jgi:hypothetical protein